MQKPKSASGINDHKLVHLTLGILATKQDLRSKYLAHAGTRFTPIVCKSKQHPDEMR